MEETSQGQTRGPSLSREEVALVELFRTASPDNQSLILRYATAAASEQGGTVKAFPARPKLLSYALVLLMIGCATPTTGVVPRGQDLYTVTRQGGGFAVTTDSLKAAAIKEADAFCSERGKRLNVLHTKEIPAGVLGRWPESEILFKCE